MTRTRYSAAAAAGMAAYIGLALRFLGDYHNHGGDYAQYLIHARNVMHGRPWGYLLDGLPAVLPGYPLFLVPQLTAFGLKFSALSVLNVLMVLGTATVYLLYCRKGGVGGLYALAGFAIALFNPLVFELQQSLIPNILYMFLVSVALIVSDGLLLTWGDRRRLNVYLLGGLAVLAPAFVRLESIALYAALALYVAALKKGSGKVCLAGGLAVLALVPLTGSMVIENITAMGGYGVASVKSVMIPGSISELPWWGASFLAVLSETVWAIPGMWFEAFLPKAAFLVAGTAGIYILLLRRSLVAIFLCMHVLSLAPFVLIWNELPERYLVPIAWIWVFATVVALDAATAAMRSKASGASGRRLASLISAAVIGALAVTAVIAFVPALEVPRQSNYHTLSEVQETFDFVATNYPRRPIGFYKPRVASLMLDIAGTPTQAIVVRSPEQALGVLEDGGVVVVRDWMPYGNQSMLNSLRDRCLPAFNLGAHYVFAGDSGYCQK